MNWLTAQAERPCAEPEKHVRSQESAQRFHTRIICFVFAYTDHLLGEKCKSFHAVVSCLSHKSPGYETRKKLCYKRACRLRDSYIAGHGRTEKPPQFKWFQRWKQASTQPQPSFSDF